MQSEPVAVVRAFADDKGVDQDVCKVERGLVSRDAREEELLLVIGEGAGGEETRDGEMGGEPREGRKKELEEECSV